MKRFLKDIITGDYFKYARKSKNEFQFKHTIELSQKLFPNDAKINNLKIAIRNIEKVTISPNQFFSFWKAVGAPNEKNGFQKSRTIVNGELIPTTGGGLCQLSGIIYFMALKAGLQIIERHAHSLDIYTEETRFAPLGSDATVAYGYKDLKIKNNLNSPIQFKFIISYKQLIIQLLHASEIRENTLKFQERKLENGAIEVTTFMNEDFFGKSVYKKPKN